MIKNLLNIRTAIDRLFSEHRQQKAKTENPFLDAQFLFYCLFLQQEQVHEGVQLDWDQVCSRLEKLLESFKDQVVEPEALIKALCKEFNYPNPTHPEVLTEQLKQAYQKSGELPLPSQTLGQRYHYLIQGYQDSSIDGVSASLANYEGQDIKNPGTHMGFGDKDLVYCIIAQDKYKIASDKVVPRQIAFTRFASSNLSFEPQKAEVQELIHHELNQDLKNKINQFLKAPKTQERFVVANTSLADPNHSHVISIQMEKKGKQIKVVFFDSVGTILDEENGEWMRFPGPNDAWQDQVIAGLIQSLAPELTVACEHPAVNPQQDANCLIETVNKQVAFDLGCQEKDLTPEEVSNVRSKVDKALHLTLPLPLEEPNAPVYDFTKTITDSEEKSSDLDLSEDEALLRYEEKLIKITQQYSAHLFEAAKKLNPSVLEEDKKLKPDFTGRAVDQDNYLKIVNKYAITQELLGVFQQEQPVQQRIKQFNNLLNNQGAALKEHRDPDWKHYFKSCMIILGVLATGILPGLAVLLSYTSLKEKSSPLFFTKAKGEEFVDKAEQLKNHKLK